MAVPNTTPLTMTQIKAEFTPRSDPYWNLGAYFRGGNPMIDGRAPDNAQSHALNSSTGLGDANYYNYRNIYHCWVGLPPQAVVPNLSSNANVHRQDNPPVSFGQLKGASKLLPVGNTIDMGTLHYHNPSPTHTWTSPYTNISIPFDTSGYTFQWSKLTGGTGPLEFTNPNDLNTAFRIVDMVHGNESAWICRMTATKGAFQIIEDVFVNILNYNVPSLEPSPGSSTPYVRGYLMGDNTATVSADLFTAANGYVESSAPANTYSTVLAAGCSSNLTSFTYSWLRISGDTRFVAETPAGQTTRIYATLPNDNSTYTARFRVTINGSGSVGSASDFFDVDVSLRLNAVPTSLTLISNTGSTAAGALSEEFIGFSSTNRTITTASSGVTMSGNSSGYSFSWARISGSTTISCSNPNSLNTSFSAVLPLGASATGVWTLTATGPGPTVSLDYDVSIYHTNGNA